MKQFKEVFVEVFVPMIEAKFGLFQVQQKRVPGHAFELLEMWFGKAPERLDAVDVRGTMDKFILCVVDAKMAVKPDVDQAIISAPAIGVDHRRDVNFTPNNGLQRLFRVIWNDFGVHLGPAFEQAEDDGFTTCSPAPFAAHPARAEVAFVEFDRPHSPAGTGLQATSRWHRRRYTSLTARKLKPVKRAALEAVKSKAKSRNK